MATVSIAKDDYLPVKAIDHQDIYGCLIGFTNSKLTVNAQMQTKSSSLNLLNKIDWL